MAPTRLPHLLPLAGAILLLAILSLPVGARGEEAPLSEKGCPACEEFDRVNTLVRDGKVDRREAKRILLDLFPAIGNYYRRSGGRDYPPGEWVFPLRGYGIRAIDGGRRHGYVPGGYDYFDGNRHKGHPSFDIFIRDRNQDQRDDTTGDFVPVLSLTGGVVVARETEWEPGSALRGGKYLWIYDPGSDSLVYYAHNRELAVAVGDLVRPGDVIAYVGRTGLNAYKRRSPTHLHLTLLHPGNGTFRPDYIYPQLSRARVVR